MTYNNTNHCGGTEISNVFAKFFSSVFNKPTIHNPIPSIDNINLLSINFNKCILTINDIYDEINLICTKSCPGPDAIPSTFFTECKFVLSIPLLHLFNLSLSSGVFPDRWKVSSVSPIPKGGDSTQITNYRPISITSVIPKMFESIISKKLIPIFKNIIIDEQHGFMSSRSTCTNLLVLQHYLLDAFKAGLQVDVIYTDFSKAFDKIDHGILSAKLYNLGIRNPFYSWLVSFLTGRKQYVKIKNFNSSMYDVSSGVPQGSHIAPLLFNIFINDIKLTNSHMLLFADDLKLFRIIKSPNDAVLLQNDINVLSDWCSKNNLLLNVSKCKVLTFSKKRVKYLHDYLLYESELSRVYKNCDLGIIFDESLTFNEHYLYIQNKASSMLGFINRNCKSFNNPYALKALYYSYVRSILDYASMVWSPSRIGPIRALESIQNRFLRFLSFKCDIQRQPHSSYLPILTVLNMESLEIRKKRLDLCFIFKLLNG